MMLLFLSFSLWIWVNSRDGFGVQSVLHLKHFFPLKLAHDNVIYTNKTILRIYKVEKLAVVKIVLSWLFASV